MSARSTVLRTTCNRDCPDACGILAHIEDGKVARLQGDPLHPVTKGFLCYRTDRFLERQYSPERLTQPLVRRNGALVPVEWDEALDFCARELLRIRAESGPAAVLHYRSGGSLGMMKHVTDYFFECFGPVTLKRGDICNGAGNAAQRLDFGDEDSNDLDDLAHTRAVILWGKNPHTSSPHLLPVLLALRNARVPIALVDPVRHRGVGISDVYVQPRPRGDVSLALGVAQVLFDRGWTHPDAPQWCDGIADFHALAHSRTLEAFARDADVTVDAIVSVATLFGTRKPAAILVGWGMQRRTNGTAIVRCLDALGALTGNVGVKGGGVSFYFKRRGAFDLSFVHGTSARTVIEPCLGQEILDARDPPLRAVWITAGNPVAMLPESLVTYRALGTRELVVVVDTVMTDTAAVATVVLPTTTMLEDDDVVGAYGHPYLGAVRPVVLPANAVRSDFAITQAMALRVGLGDALHGSARDWQQRMLGTVPLGDLYHGAVRSPSAPKVAFAGRVFATPSGKVQLLRALPPEGEALTADYPLRLQALSTPQSQSSQWSPDEPDDVLPATVHPDAARGMRHGDRAVLRSAVGVLSVRVILDAGQRRDVVTVPKGGSLRRGRCANAITRAVLTDAGDGAALYEQPVRLDPG